MTFLVDNSPYRGRRRAQRDCVCSEDGDNRPWAVERLCLTGRRMSGRDQTSAFEPPPEIAGTRAVPRWRAHDGSVEDNEHKEGHPMLTDFDKEIIGGNKRITIPMGDRFVLRRVADALHGLANKLDYRSRMEPTEE